MPFLDAQTRRAYQRGYQTSYRLPEDVTPPPVEAIDNPFESESERQAFMKGYLKGCANRSASQIHHRQAAWRQTRQETISARQRTRRRQKGALLALHVLSQLSEVANKTNSKANA